MRKYINVYARKEALKVNVLSVLNVLKQGKSRLRASTLRKYERTQTYSKHGK